MLALSIDRKDDRRLAKILTMVSRCFLSFSLTYHNSNHRTSSDWRQMYLPTVIGIFLLHDKSSFRNVRLSWAHCALPQSTMLTMHYRLRHDTMTSKLVTFYVQVKFSWPPVCWRFVDRCITRKKRRLWYFCSMVDTLISQTVKINII